MMLCSVYIIVVLESPVVVKRHALFHRLLGGREGGLTSQNVPVHENQLWDRTFWDRSYFFGQFGTDRDKCFLVHISGAIPID